MRVTVRRFHLVPLTVHPTPREGYGRIEFILDGGRFDLPQYSGANGRYAVADGSDGEYSPADRPEITYSGIPPGRHVLTARLAGLDGTPVSANETVSFLVR